jgi:hypothetical protein
MLRSTWHRAGKALKTKNGWAALLVSVLCFVAEAEAVSENNSSLTPLIFKIKSKYVHILLLPLFFVSSVCAANPSGIANYYGEYKIYEVRKIGGGITSDSWASRWKGSVVRIQPKLFSIREDHIDRPYYSEGEVISNELSIFFGIGRKRQDIKRILVYENGSEKYPYEKIEILDENNFLDMYDGRIYFFRREK